ncbi:MAG TPA: sigma-70 family RNA polymerase sigma factor [Sedimentibacter sp.]|jgi:RNA polymerase sigma factor (sigma-70 family)|nr:sigma-70 family RNA polymerase sigma factor [Sedimentibacter sp.]HAS91380.1 RNA polymerase subunit sigma-24 [Clostridiales bacterium]HOA20371.1 sigma-70 family RNA polymerase sigma factor [Sedimentibacter sp.]HOG61995.1 sigma-70 family RNA polymerase sigma factor [Sedimentibacter sp.]HOT22418.1 sigma-70 family RNA polymerase sigma factor [Sedimentibacter sp.]
MNNNERWLVEESRKGNVEAFEELIKDYKKTAYNIALRIMRNVEDAEDASQEALIKIFKNISSFNMESTFKVWMYRIIVNTCIDFKRRKNISTVSIDETMDLGSGREVQREISDESYNPDALIERNYSTQLVNDAINALEDDFKTIIILRDIKGFTYDEISQILSCNLGTVKSRLSRARKRLRELLENEMKVQG